MGLFRKRDLVIDALIKRVEKLEGIVEDLESGNKFYIEKDGEYDHYEKSWGLNLKMVSMADIIRAIVKRFDIKYKDGTSGLIKIKTCKGDNEAN